MRKQKLVRPAVALFAAVGSLVWLCGMAIGPAAAAGSSEPSAMASGLHSALSDNGIGEPETTAGTDGSCQHCDVTLTNVSTGFDLGINHVPIVWSPDGGGGQLWDIYTVTGTTNLFVIYNHNSSEVLTHTSGCTSHGGNYEYCATLTSLPTGANPAETQEWYETVLSGNNLVFEGVGTQRGLDDPCGCSSSKGDQVVLFPYNTSDTAQIWHYS